MKAHRRILISSLTVLLLLALYANSTAQTEGDNGKGEDVYAAIAENIIKANWRWPQFANLALVCIVELQIHPDGRIESAKLIQSSGRTDFDKSALRAVQETETLPSPPLTPARLKLTFNSQGKR